MSAALKAYCNDEIQRRALTEQIKALVEKRDALAESALAKLPAAKASLNLEVGERRDYLWDNSTTWIRARVDDNGAFSVSITQLLKL